MQKEGKSCGKRKRPQRITAKAVLEEMKRELIDVIITKRSQNINSIRGFINFGGTIWHPIRSCENLRQWLKHNMHIFRSADYTERVAKSEWESLANTLCDKEEKRELRFYPEHFPDSVHMWTESVNSGDDKKHWMLDCNSRTISEVTRDSLITFRATRPSLDGCVMYQGKTGGIRPQHESKTGEDVRNWMNMWMGVEKASEFRRFAYKFLSGTLGVNDIFNENYRSQMDYSRGLWGGYGECATDLLDMFICFCGKYEKQKETLRKHISYGGNITYNTKELREHVSPWYVRVAFGDAEDFWKGSLFSSFLQWVLVK